MVRLKGTVKQRETHIMRCFNSTMVRLKAAIASHRVAHPVSFQFHNGSIKSQTALADRVNFEAFQFHNGSIKSRKTGLRSERRDVGFNSTMVRLKAMRYSGTPIVAVSS